VALKDARHFSDNRRIMREQLRKIVLGHELSSAA
jgi:hypothetical protein